MEIITNKFNIKIHDNFREGFDVLCLSLKDEYQNTEYINRIELMANNYINYFESILITSTSVKEYNKKVKCLWILIRKDEELKRLILKSLEKFKEVHPRFQKNEQIMLLIATLPKFKVKNISNVIGAIYQYVDQKSIKNQLVFLEYQVFNGIITQKVRTFTRYKIACHFLKNNEKKQTRYNFENGVLKVSINHNDEDYIFGNKTSSEGKKNTVEFFRAAKTIDGFIHTKSYYLHKMINDINKYLSDYISVDYEILKTSHENIKNNVDLNIDVITNEQYNIVNQSLNTSEEVLEKLKICLEQSFPKHYIDITSSKRVNKNKINIVVVNRKSDYEDLKIKDKHLKTSEYVRQHIQLHKLEKAYNEINKSSKNIKECMIGKVILTDAIIKKEIINNDMKLYTFDNNFFDGYKFILPIKDKNNLRKFVSVTIQENEKFKFEIENSNFDPKFYFQIKGYIQSQQAKYTILNTDQILLPNIEFVMDKYNKVDMFGRVNKEQLYTALNKFSNLIDQESNQNIIDYWYKNKKIIENNIEKIKHDDLTSEDVRISIGSLKDIARHGIYGKFVEFFYREFDKMIAPLLNSKKARLNYLSGFTGINYYQEDKETYYSVGHSKLNDLKNSLGKSIRFKKISSIDVEFLNEYFKLLDVAFIRYKRATVVPFPFKYIREYVEMNKDLINLNDEDD